MTQAQIDQLLGFASAEIDRHMAGLTIQGGGGVYVDGFAADQTVGVQLPQQREDTRTPLGEMTLHLRITGAEDFINREGRRHQDIDSGELTIKNIRSGDWTSWSLWEVAWVIDAVSAEGAHRRELLFEFELSPYRFALTAHIQFIGPYYEIWHEEKLDLDRPGVIRYRPSPPLANRGAYLWIPRLARRGTEGPFARLLNADLPPSPNQ